MLFRLSDMLMMNFPEYLSESILHFRNKFFQPTLDFGLNKDRSDVDNFSLWRDQRFNLVVFGISSSNFGVPEIVDALKYFSNMLKNGLWNEVYEDWPFYTNVERQQFSRREKKNLTPPEPDCGNSVSSIGYDHS